MHWKFPDRVTCLPNRSLLDLDCDRHKFTGTRGSLTAIPNIAERLLVVDAQNCLGEMSYASDVYHPEHVDFPTPFG